MQPSQRNLEIILGTAMWGWTIEREQAFALADLFYEGGGRWFDTASNYPINKDPSAFGRAERWLGEWIGSRGHADVAVVAKFGSVSNDGSPGSDLSSRRLARLLPETQERLFGSVRLVSVHWDDRDDPVAIADTLDFFRATHQNGLAIGLSGIRHPKFYAEKAPELQHDWSIQVKHNALTQAAYAEYKPFHGKSAFLAYGLNAGGLSVGPNGNQGQTARARGASVPDALADAERRMAALAGRQLAPRSLNELSIATVRANPDMSGIIIGPSRAAHVADTFSYVASLSFKAARDLLTATDTI